MKSDVDSGLLADEALANIFVRDIEAVTRVDDVAVECLFFGMMSSKSRRNRD